MRTVGRFRQRPELLRGPAAQIPVPDQAHLREDHQLRAIGGRLLREPPHGAEVRIGILRHRLELDHGGADRPLLVSHASIVPVPVNCARSAGNFIPKWEL
jgi:hypothetical protein